MSNLFLIPDGECAGRQERDDQDQGATGGREKDISEHQDKTIGTGWYISAAYISITKLPS